MGKGGEGGGDVQEKQCVQFTRQSDSNSLCCDPVVTQSFYQRSHCESKYCPLRDSRMTYGLLYRRVLAFHKILDTRKIQYRERRGQARTLTNGYTTVFRRSTSRDGSESLESLMSASAHFMMAAFPRRSNSSAFAWWRGVWKDRGAVSIGPNLISSC